MPNPVGTSAGSIRLVAFSMFLYDYLLTLPEEIEHIWKQRWTLAKVLFLLLRYTSFIHLTVDTVFVWSRGVSPKVCEWYPNFAAVSVVLTVVIVQAILQLRIWVLYERRKLVLWGNIALCLVEYAASGAVLVTQFPKTVQLSAPDWVLGACYSKHQSTMALGFVAPLIYETYLAILAIWKLYKEDHVLPGRHRSTILVRLVHDSALYFVFIATAMAVSIYLFASHPVIPGFASVGLVDAAGAIGGARIILSMRTAGAREYNDSRLPSHTRAEDFVSANPNIAFSPSRTSHAGETTINGDGFNTYHIGESPRSPSKRKSSRSDRWEVGTEWRSVLRPIDEATSQAYSHSRS